jgi:hypothetical protein
MPDQPLDSEISLRGIIGVGVILIGVTAAVTALMWWMSLGLRSRMAADDPPPAALPEARSQPTPAGPLLQSDPIGEMRQMREEESAILDHAEWIDKDSATVRLSIDTALDIIARSGELPNPGQQEGPSNGTAEGGS